MTIELVSLATGRTILVSARAFGRLLHLAKQNGWEPERTEQEWPESTWDTQVLQPYVNRYMRGKISADEARSLRRALVKASATGQVLIEGGLSLTSEAVLQAARQGAFQVRYTADDPLARAA
jgi:hypothetical protein